MAINNRLSLDAYNALLEHIDLYEDGFDGAVFNELFTTYSHEALDVFACQSAFQQTEDIKRLALIRLVKHLIRNETSDINAKFGQFLATSQRLDLSKNQAMVMKPLIDAARDCANLAINDLVTDKTSDAGRSRAHNNLKELRFHLTLIDAMNMAQELSAASKPKQHCLSQISWVIGKKEKAPVVSTRVLEARMSEIVEINEQLKSDLRTILERPEDDQKQERIQAVSQEMVENIQTLERLEKQRQKAPKPITVAHIEDAIGNANSPIMRVILKLRLEVSNRQLQKDLIKQVGLADGPQSVFELRSEYHKLLSKIEPSDHEINALKEQIKRAQEKAEKIQENLGKKPVDEHNFARTQISQVISREQARLERMSTKLESIKKAEPTPLRKIRHRRIYLASKIKRQAPTSAMWRKAKAMAESLAPKVGKTPEPNASPSASKKPG